MESIIKKEVNPLQVHFFLGDKIYLWNILSEHVH